MKINKDLKYNKSEYTDFFFPSDDMNTDIQFYHSKLVKTRKNHTCSYCGAIISKGSYAVQESGFLEHKPFKVYNCMDCVNEYLDFWHGEITDNEMLSRWHKRATANHFI